MKLARWLLSIYSSTCSVHLCCEHFRVPIISKLLWLKNKTLIMAFCLLVSERSVTFLIVWATLLTLYALPLIEMFYSLYQCPSRTYHTIVCNYGIWYMLVSRRTCWRPWYYMEIRSHVTHGLLKFTFRKAMGDSEYPSDCSNGDKRYDMNRNKCIAQSKWLCLSKGQGGPQDFRRPAA